MRLTNQIAAATTIAVVAGLFSVGAALGHHTKGIEVDPSCVTKDVTLDINHEIYGGHKLEWELSVDGSKVAGATQLPDSRYSTTIVVLDVVPYGSGVITARARATYANGEPESKWVEGSAKYDCPKPPPVHVDKLIRVESKGMLCGDPRAWTRVRNTGNVAATVQMSFLPGNKQKPAIRKYVSKTLSPGSTKTIGPRWLRGQVRLRVYDADAGAWAKLFAYKVGKTLKPLRWNQGACPANRFGTPGFGRPMIRGNYARSYQVIVPAKH